MSGDQTGWHPGIMFGLCRSRRRSVTGALSQIAPMVRNWPVVDLSGNVVVEF